MYLILPAEVHTMLCKWSYKRSTDVNMNLDLKKKINFYEIPEILELRGTAAWSEVD